MDRTTAAYELIKRNGPLRTNHRLSVAGQLGQALGCTNGWARHILEKLAATGLVVLEYRGRAIAGVSIAPHHQLVIGGIYRHHQGLRYRVKRRILDASHYEQGGQVRSAVLYEQLEAGQYPAGTEWVRSEASFLEQSQVDGRFVPTFVLEA